MMRKIVRLERDTIVEAVFEVRFEGINKTLADLLPGILFAEFKDRSPKALRTPTSDVPREMQHADETLRYLPRQGLEIGAFRVLVGDYAALVSNRRPYVGWKQFKRMIVDVLGHLQRSELITSIERCSLKYVNLIQNKGTFKEQFSPVKLSAMLGQRDLTQFLTIVRTEIHEQGMLNIVELSPGTKVTLPGAGSAEEGLMVAVDTLNTSVAEFWANQDAILDRTHDVEKSIYFDILTKETLSALGPVYE